MGNKLFGKNIAGQIAKKLGPLLLAATLTSVIKGTRGANLSAGTQTTETTHQARGFVDTYADSKIDGTIIRQGDRKITLLGDSISPAVVPKPNDRISIEGREYVIHFVERDPDAATYECASR